MVHFLKKYTLTAAPSYVEPPVTPGHEFSGHAVALGPGAADHHGVQEGKATNIKLNYI